MVSPSDLPDSPLDSPRPLTPKVLSNGNETQNSLNNEKQNSNNIEIKCNIDCHSNEKNMGNNVFEDKPINFATEDTPAVYSLSMSLSSLNDEIDHNFDNEKHRIEGIPKEIEVLKVDDIKTEIISTSSEDEGEDELLAACISSGKDIPLYSCYLLYFIVFDRNEDNIQ